MKVRLSEADRARYGIAEEWLDFDPLYIRNKDTIFLQGIGYPNREDWSQALQGRPLTNPDGSYIYEYDDEGQKKIGDDGMLVVRRGPHEELAWNALVWMCLRSHGVTVEWEDLEYSERGLQTRSDEGKAAAAETKTTAETTSES